MSRVAEEKKEPRFCENEHLVCLNGETKCPLCGEELSSTIPTDEREISAYSREAHNRDIAGYDKSQNALCFVVIGGTVFTIGILFIFLSLQKKFNKIVGINVASFQFAICVIALLTGAVLLTIGLIGLFKALGMRKRAAAEVAYLSTLKRNGK